MIKYTEDHEWISLDGDIATVGVTDYAQKALGDVVFVELPEVGTNFSKGDEVAVVESVKAASEVFAPLDGEVTEVNDALEAEPALVNKAPTTKGWFFRLRLTDASTVDALMSEESYGEFVAGLD